MQPGSAQHQPADPTLEELMERYQQGDTAAVTMLITRLSPALLRFFSVQMLSRRYADDLLQDTWLRIHEARHTYRPGEPALPWIYAIARHTRVDHYRKARRAETREQQVERLPEPAAADFGRTEHSGRTGVDLAAVMGELPDGQREVIAMLKISGMSLEEVAQATSSSVGSVKQKAHRAYNKLRELLTEAGFGTSEAGRK